jgi:hypothetical protein
MGAGAMYHSARLHIREINKIGRVDAMNIVEVSSFAESALVAVTASSSYNATAKTLIARRLKIILGQ